MNSSYFNAIAGTFLGIVFVTMTIVFLSDSLFHNPPPKEEGFVIEVADSGSALQTAPKTDIITPIGPLLANADIDAGKKVFKKCAACHTINEGGVNKVGPALWDIINQPVGVKDGFSYSSAMKEYAAGNTLWGYENLNKFLLKPRTYLKGTAMSFAGLKKEKDRANLIAYLRSYSSNPAPLPQN